MDRMTPEKLEEIMKYIDEGDKPPFHLSFDCVNEIEACWKEIAKLKEENRTLHESSKVITIDEPATLKVKIKELENELAKLKEEQDNG